EGMEEFFLRLVLAGNELHVVNNKDVGIAVVAGKIRILLIADGIDEFLDELLSRDIDDTGRRILGDDGVADGLDEVCLADADTAVDKERVVLGARVGGNG